MRVGSVVGMFAVTVLVAGCGGSSGSAIVTVTSTATETASVTPEQTSASPSMELTVQPTASPKATPATVKVPDGVGMNYQEAQDLWRSAGLVVLPATDATGSNRIPVLDSNWYVVAQDLKPGSKVERDTGITATVKKYTDR